MTKSELNIWIAKQRNCLPHGEMPLYCDLPNVCGNDHLSVDFRHAMVEQFHSISVMAYSGMRQCTVITHDGRAYAYESDSEAYAVAMAIWKAVEGKE
jgi:hypothetical protein